MSRQTKVIFEDTALTPEVLRVIGDEVEILVAQGKTDGIKQQTMDDPVPGQSTTIRTWIDLQTAEEWIIFINALQVPPVSSGILPETP